MTLKEFREYAKMIPDEMADKVVLAIGIRDEKDIVNNNDGTITIPEFSERYSVENVKMIMEGTMAPKLFFTTSRKK
jgi:hypothetical protein